MESGKSTVDLLRLCRTCKAECSHVNSLFAEGDDAFGPGLADMLFSCTNLKVVEDDGFPSSICDKCVNSLKTAYQFQQQCKNANQYYQQQGLKSIAPSYDYIFILKDDSAVFTCRECSCSFNTFREFKNHKVIHLKNEINEEPCSNIETIYIKEEKEDEDYVEFKEQDELIIQETTICMKSDNEDSDILGLKRETDVIHDIKLERKSSCDEEDVYSSSGCWDFDYPGRDIEEKHESEFKKRKSVIQGVDIEKKSCSDGEDTNHPPSGDYSLNGAEHQKRRKTLQSCKKSEGKVNSSKTGCPWRWTPLDDLKEHPQSCDTSNKLFKCDICEKSYSQSSDLAEHKHTHKEKTRYECDICGKPFLYTETLHEHRKTHGEKEHPQSRDTSNKLFKCDICEKSYSESSNLAKHKQTHKEKTRYECDICGKPNLYKETLHEHRKTHNEKEHPQSRDISNKLFKCDICEKSYSRSSNLAKHRHTHKENTRYACDICGKSYLYRETLDEHRQTHGKKEPYKCDVCEKSYLDRKDLLEHREVHSGQKRYECDICRKSYFFKQNLETHRRTHGVKKHYRCQVCRKLCFYKQTFLEHMETHTAEEKSSVSTSGSKVEEIISSAMSEESCSYTSIETDAEQKEDF